jgi:hypothetical protein
MVSEQPSHTMDVEVIHDIDPDEDVKDFGRL